MVLSVSTTIQWIAMKLGTDIQVTLKLQVGVQRVSLLSFFLTI